jgi:hypothetical protein
MRQEKSKTFVIRYQPVSDSRVLPREPATEKRGLSPALWVAAMVPKVMAGKRRHPRIRRSARASPLEGQRGEATLDPILLNSPPIMRRVWIPMAPRRHSRALRQLRKVIMAV